MTWSYARARNPVALLLFIYVLVGVLYGLYAWGVYELMHRVIFTDRAPDRNNPIGMFWVFGAGIVLVILIGGDLERERLKTRRLMEVVKACESLVNEIYTCATKSTEVVQLRNGSGPAMSYTPRNAVYESILMFIMTSVLLLWEFSVVGRLDGSEGNGIVAMFTKQMVGFNSNVPSSFNDMFILARTHWGVVMFNMARQRVVKLSEKKILSFGMAELSPPITRMKEACDNFTTEARHNKYWWINVAVRAFGVLYMASVPLLLFPTQGVLLILWSVVAYVVFQSILIYRFFIGNVLANPTKWDAQPVLDEITRMCATVDTWFATVESKDEAAPRNISNIIAGLLAPRSSSRDD
jgi:hypothetical protein